jgi:tRNA(fMet)-specific endonuclease VapC
MYILDTDHISIFDAGGSSAQPLIAKLSRIDPSQVCTTIVTYEEQMRGWLSYIAKATSIETQIIAYRKLERQLANYRNVTVVSFDDRAGRIFQDLRKVHPRLGSMDLKIAAIAIANQALVLTRNTKDFGQVQNLSIEDWTI